MEHMKRLLHFLTKITRQVPPRAEQLELNLRDRRSRGRR
jgi:hypothetical protein